VPVPHIRILRHYIHTAYLIIAAFEAGLVVVAVYVAYWLRADDPTVESFWHFSGAVVYAAVVLLSMAAMGVYESQVREGYIGMMLRTAVAIFLIASIGSGFVFYFLPDLALWRGTLAVAAIASFVLIAMFRWLALGLLDRDRLKRRVLVLGTGARAAKVASRMRRRYDQRGFLIHGYLPLEQTADQVSAHGGRILSVEEPLADYCQRNGIDEIVVALDERRRNRESSAGLPLDDLLECRFSGIDVCDVQAFIEREAGKLDIDLLQPSWMVFSDGFVRGTWRTGSKRLFDLAASVGLLLVAWPVMLLAAFAIWADSGFKGPILYRQQRVGLDGRYFEVTKFRSMRTDAEVGGTAVWATANDPRVTRVGRFLRRTRIDELPQLFNVIHGDMSFVGPRPERPEFVGELIQKIPYYAHRHRIKPGLTGWAQLCYPYGASLDDAREKLQYDLYYLKNHSILLDLIILIQTVDVVLVGEGAR
jgi:sugar transferase (PEP-CTERM system associated)